MSSRSRGVSACNARLALVALAVASSVAGCGLVWDPDGYRARETVWTCSVTVRDAAGASLVVRGDDPVLQAALPREFRSDPRCPIDGVEAMEEDFLRWVQAALPERFEGRDGPWCVAPVPGAVVCEEERSRPAEEAACLDPLPSPPMSCDPAGRCLEVEPPVVNFEAILEGMGLDGRSPVGFPETRVRPAVSVRNTCEVPVRVLLDDEIQGESPEDFAILANSCGPSTPEEESRGRELAASGAAGDTCGFEVEFRPSRHATARIAEKRFSQDTTELYSVPLAGRARGGRLAGVPSTSCFDALVGPRGACASATAVTTLSVTNPGPGRLTVESLAATGQFQVDAPAVSFVLEPGEPFNIDLWWCGDAGDVDDDGSLLITDNGFSATTEVLLERRSAGCP